MPAGKGFCDIFSGTVNGSAPGCLIGGRTDDDPAVDSLFNQNVFPDEVRRLPVDKGAVFEEKHGGRLKVKRQKAKVKGQKSKGKEQGAGSRGQGAGSMEQGGRRTLPAGVWLCVRGRQGRKENAPSTNNESRATNFTNAITKTTN